MCVIVRLFPLVLLLWPPEVGGASGTSCAIKWALPSLSHQIVALPFNTPHVQSWYTIINCTRSYPGFVRLSWVLQARLWMTAVYLMLAAFHLLMTSFTASKNANLVNIHPWQYVNIWWDTMKWTLSPWLWLYTKTALALFPVSKGGAMLGWFYPGGPPLSSLWAWEQGYNCLQLDDYRVPLGGMNQLVSWGGGGGGGGGGGRALLRWFYPGGPPLSSPLRAWDCLQLDYSRVP